MLDLTNADVKWCLRLYRLFCENGVRKGRGFRSKRDLCQRLESSLNPSTSVYNLIGALLNEGVLFEEDGFLLLDKDEFQRVYESTEFYRLIDFYEWETQSFRSSSKFVK